jgi:hypothetical protein
MGELRVLARNQSRDGSLGRAASMLRGWPGGEQDRQAAIYELGGLASWLVRSRVCRDCVRDREPGVGRRSVIRVESLRGALLGPCSRCIPVLARLA